MKEREREREREITNLDFVMHNSHAALEPHTTERSDCELAFKIILAEQLKVEEPFIAKVLTDLQSSQLSDLSSCCFDIY